MGDVLDGGPEDTEAPRDLLSTYRGPAKCWAGRGYRNLLEEETGHEWQ